MRIPNTQNHKQIFIIKNRLNKIIARRKEKKLCLTSFTEDGIPEHSVDSTASCPRCLAAEASKPGATDGEF